MKNRGTGRRICRQRAESANESWAHIQQKMQARPEQRTAQRLATRMRGDSSIHLVEGSVPLGLHARDLGRRLEADEGVPHDVVNVAVEKRNKHVPRSRVLSTSLAGDGLHLADDLGDKIQRVLWVRAWTRHHDIMAI